MNHSINKENEMTEYLLKLGIGGESFYEATSGEVAANRAMHLAERYNTTVNVYKPYFTAKPRLRDDETLAEKHLNDTIEEPSRTWQQNASALGTWLEEMQKINMEAFRKLYMNCPDEPSKAESDEPASNVITNKPQIHPSLLGVKKAVYHSCPGYSDLVGEPSVPQAYEVYQRRVEFLSNFDNGRKLYNENPLFRSITENIMRGANVYELLLELVFMQDGRCAPETSHLSSQPNAGTPGADAPNKKI